MKKILLLTLIFLIFSGCSAPTEVEKISQKISEENSADYEIEYLPTHSIVESAREQIGVVTKYDTGYYQGGYPPEDRGACTDVIEQALRANGYDLKAKIDQDMKSNPGRYPSASDPNINFRRVRNVKVFLDHFAESLPTCTESSCIKESDWQPGDIVTYDQIPGSLWHIAIISNQIKTYTDDGRQIPFLIHNYSRGTVENDFLLSWPAPITGHYRIKEIK